jgi:hypothetical protein
MQERQEIVQGNLTPMCQTGQNNPHPEKRFQVSEFHLHPAEPKQLLILHTKQFSIILQNFEEEAGLASKKCHFSTLTLLKSLSL